MTTTKHQQSGKVTIVGAGAIGITIAYLASQHIETTLITKKGQNIPYIISGSISIKDGKRALLIKGIDDFAIDPGSPVIIAVKTYDLESTLLSIEPRLLESTPVVLVQNGLGIFMDAAAVLKRRIPYVRALLYFGARAVSDEEILVFGAPSAVLAAPDYAKGSLIHVAKVFEDIGFTVTLHTNVALAEWEKALVSLSIVPVAALKNATNDIFTRSNEAKSDVMKLLSEARSIAASEGFKDLKPNDEELLTSASSFGENKNSLLLDIERGKNSELESTLGRALRIAKSNNVPAPTLASYYDKLNRN